MQRVDASEAEARWFELLDRVADGEHITITRHGEPVAVILPASSKQQAYADADVIAGIKRFREQHSLDGLSIRQMIEEGRK
ncbi:MAG: type II toxin-antitoxin system Phd/YefM family antitoxin [Candidatus Hydrogenedentota bacterium]